MHNENVTYLKKIPDNISIIADYMKDMKDYMREC